ncbi:hypothetical protein [Halomonas halocynthiae]|uniref:hypothetical protein n=1 Tax=Halomonas halocynthiae TaxID=176290 RepID=UPI0004832B3A|nr:hypothetical protein [Halomonas halocynthiae]
MMLRVILWLLGFMLKKAQRSKSAFQEQLETRPLDWGIATEDLAIARYYRMSADGIETGTGLPVDLDLELRFDNPQSAMRILRKPTQKAFLDGMMNDHVRLVGDSRDLERLQALLKHIR